MKIVSYKCPNCGAKLGSDLDRKKVFCEYCGSEIVFDEEFQKVVLSEQNIKDLAQEINKGVDPEVLNAVQKIRGSLGQYQCLQADNMQKQSTITKLEAKRRKQASLIRKVIPWGIMALMIFILVQMVRYSDIHILLRLLVFLIGMIISLLSFRIIRFSMRTRLSEIDENIRILKAEMEDQNIKIMTIRKESNFSLIPDKYLCVDAVDYIYSALASKRAITIQQAILGYEEKLQNDRLEQIRIEELRLHRQQLDELKNIKAQNARLQEETARMMEENNRNSKSKISLGDAVKLGGAFAIGASLAKKIKDDLL